MKSVPMIRNIAFFLIVILSSINIYGKDYAWECVYKTKKYLADNLQGAYGSSDYNDDEIIDEFIRHYHSSNNKLALSIDRDGAIMMNSRPTTIDNAISEINQLEHQSGEVVVLLSLIQSKKSDKLYKKLSKALYKVIERREEYGLEYDQNPLLCTDYMMGKRVVHQIVAAAKIAGTVDNNSTDNSTAVSDVKTVVADDDESAAVQKQPKSVAKKNTVITQTQTLALSPVNQTAVLNTSDEVTGEYTVNVGSTLTVRSEPSTSGKRLGSLANGETIEVEGLVNDWAKIKYNDESAYVNYAYLQKTEPTPYTDYLSTPYWRRSFAHFCYRIMPFAILVSAIMLFVFFDTGFGFWCAFALGLFELLFSVGYSKCSIGVMPWFCEPNDVGWIMTIIDFLLVCGVLIIQHGLYKQIMGNMRLGCVGYLVSYPVMFFIGAAMVCWINDFSLIIVTIVAFASVTAWFIYRKRCILKDAMLHSIWISVTLGGFMLFFANSLGLLMIGGIIFFVLSAIAQGNDSDRSSSTGNSGNSSGNSTADHSTGYLSGPDIVHSDGSRTRVYNSGGIIYDGNGHRWQQVGDSNWYTNY